jgi:sarcosine oxidase subunit beta
VRIFTQTPVGGLEPAAGGGYVVHTPRGALRARRVINATGAWSPQLGKLIGVDVPVWPIRHEICSSEPLKPFLRPMVSELASGLYCSQSMRGEIVGGVTLPGHGSTYAMGSTLQFLATYARRLVRLMPILAEIKVLRQWAGPYDQSPDGNPILGAPPEHPDFFLACGFVGHGFMMAPIIGKLYAEWLTGAPPHEIFSRYRLTRFRDGGGGVEPKEDFNIG